MIEKICASGRALGAWCNAGGRGADARNRIQAHYAPWAAAASISPSGRLEKWGLERQEGACAGTGVCGMVQPTARGEPGPGIFGSFRGRRGGNLFGLRCMFLNNRTKNDRGCFYLAVSLALLMGAQAVHAASPATPPFLSPISSYSTVQAAPSRPVVVSAVYAPFLASNSSTTASAAGAASLNPNTANTANLTSSSTVSPDPVPPAKTEVERDLDRRRAKILERIRPLRRGRKDRPRHGVARPSRGQGPRANGRSSPSRTSGPNPFRKAAASSTNPRSAGAKPPPRKPRTLLARRPSARGRSPSRT